MYARALSMQSILTLVSPRMYTNDEDRRLKCEFSTHQHLFLLPLLTPFSFVYSQDFEHVSTHRPSL